LDPHRHNTIGTSPANLPDILQCVPPSDYLIGTSAKKMAGSGLSTCRRLDPSGAASTLHHHTARSSIGRDGRSLVRSWDSGSGSDRGVSEWSTARDGCLHLRA